MENKKKSPVRAKERSSYCLVLRVQVKKRIPSKSWGCSSAGRAPALQAGGQEFDPPHLHHVSLKKEKATRMLLVNHRAFMQETLSSMANLKVLVKLFQKAKSKVTLLWNHREFSWLMQSSKPESKSFCQAFLEKRGAHSSGG